MVTITRYIKTEDGRTIAVHVKLDPNAHEAHEDNHLTKFHYEEVRESPKPSAPHQPDELDPH